MSSPADVVSEAFSIAQTYSNNAQAKLTGFTNALNAAVLATPVVNVTWAALAAPSPVTPPAHPATLDTVESELQYDPSGAIAAATPGALTAVLPTLTVDSFTDPEPTVTLPDAPVLNFGVVPTIDIGTVPVVPSIADIAIPVAPTITLPSAPALLALSTPTFGGVDLNDAFLANLESVPTLTLVAPTPYTYTPGPQYASTLLTGMQTLLAARLSGGTGLNPSVEAALWNRARDREAKTAQGSIDEIQRGSSALGFHLPAGVTAQQLRQAQRDYYDKVSGLSRDIAIKQADLEQENLKHTITSGIELEGKLIDYSYNLERLAFESAKTMAENAIEIYNAQVREFEATVAAYQAFAQAYRSIIDGQLAKVEVYKAEIQAELSKAQTNMVLVQQYEAEVRANLATVEIFRAQIEGAKTQMELEGAKLGAVGEQIRAFVAGINAETAKVEAYKVGVQAQATQVEAYTATVNAQRAVVDIYRTKAEVFSAKVGAQAEVARANISFYNGQVSAKAAEWEGWRARVAAEGERLRAVGQKSSALLDGYRADILRYEATVNQDVRAWEVAIKQYEAQQNYTLATEKLNTEIVKANKDSILEAAKTGAQVYAQLTSAAYGLFHAQASVSGGTQESVSYSYSNNTIDQPPSVTAV